MFRVDVESRDPLPELVRKKLLSMIESLDVSKFEHPLYVIVGSDDPYAPVEQISERFGEAPRVHFEVILRADHFFASGGLGELARLVQGAQF